MDTTHLLRVLRTPDHALVTDVALLQFIAHARKAADHIEANAEILAQLRGRVALLEAQVSLLQTQASSQAVPLSEYAKAAADTLLPEADKKDAARYRWLRQQHQDTWKTLGWHQGPVQDYVMRVRDKAIDKCMDDTPSTHES